MSETLPERFLARLREIIPPQNWPQVLASFGSVRRVSFRVNTLRSSVTDALAGLAAEGIEAEAETGFDNAFSVAADDKTALTRSRVYLDEDLYVQGLSSMLPPLLLAPRPGEKILDLAAAPGSKTTQLAALMENEGWISAVEVNKGRFHKLKDNLSRQEVRIAHTYLKDGSRVWRHVAEQFDRVLIDAPCSSEARFNMADPESYRYWSEKKIREMARKQGKLLFSAIQCLKPGGVLLYSTCSFAPEENELIVARAMKTFGDAVELLEVDLPFDNWQPGLTTWQNKKLANEISHCRRILPNERMEGFFLCLLHKRRSTLQQP